MAIAVVQAVKANGLGTTLSATISATVAGNLLVAVIMDAGSFVSVPSFAAPSGFVSCGTEAANLNHAYVHVYRQENNPGGITSVAFAGLTNSVQHHLYVYEISGVATSNSQDQYLSSNGASSAALNAGSLSIARKNEIVFGFYATAAGNDTPTYAVSYTGSTDATVNSTGESEYQIIATPGTYTPSITAGSVNQWSGVAISFVAPAEFTKSISTTRASAASMSRFVFWNKFITLTLATTALRSRTILKNLKVTEGSTALIKKITVLITLLFTAGNTAKLLKGRFRTISVARTAVAGFSHLRIKTIAVSLASVATVRPLRAILVAVRSLVRWAFGVTVLKQIVVVTAPEISMIRTRLRLLFVTSSSTARVLRLRLRRIFVAAGSTVTVSHVWAVAIIVQSVAVVVFSTGRIIHVLITALVDSAASLSKFLTMKIKVSVGNAITIKRPRLLKVLISLVKAPVIALTRRTSDPSLAHATRYDIQSAPATTFDIQPEQ